MTCYLCGCTGQPMVWAKVKVKEKITIDAMVCKECAKKSD